MPMARMEFISSIVGGEKIVQELATLKLGIMETAESTTNKLKDLHEHNKGIDLFHEIHFTNLARIPWKIDP